MGRSKAGRATVMTETGGQIPVFIIIIRIGPRGGLRRGDRALRRGRRARRAHVIRRV